MANRVSIIIRCCNEEQHIGRLLRGLSQQSIKDVEIIVVDSGSTDGTLSVVSQYPVRLLSIDRRDFSFGRSLNIGCRAASGDVLVIASAHVYPVCEDWLERLIAPFSDSQTALVYGRQRGSEKSKYAERQVFAKWFPSDSVPHQDHVFCNNANAAVRRSVWDVLPYDEALTGLEDIEWANRAVHKGYKIAYAADAEVIHVHNENMREIYNRYRREAIALKQIFPHEHFGIFDFVRLFPANVIQDCVRAGRERVLWKNVWEIVTFRVMQFWGTYRGFKQHGPLSSRLKQRFYYPRDESNAGGGAKTPMDRRFIEYAPKGQGGQTHVDH